ncbi:MAG TPA: pilus assembly protein PilM [Thermodesulfobacteriota bacterium]|nr:pilus assembly protein PilM [Thermodesulfobacteriota bacterium]
MISKTWGLDIGSTGIKAVEITRTWRRQQVTGYVYFPLVRKEKEELRREKIERLREILPRLGKSGENLILSFPSHRTMVHRARLPFPDRKRNERVVKFEVEPLLPFPIDQVVVDFYNPGKNQNEKESLVFALQKENLGEQISLMKEVGLDPERLVPESLALFWLAERLEITSGQSGSLLDLGREKTTMIVWQKDTLALVRSIPVAGDSAARGPLTRLVEEVKRTILSYESGPEVRPVENIFITGGLALLSGVEKIFGEGLGKPVMTLELGKKFSFFRDVPKESGPALAVALGTALGGIAPDRTNFRKEEFSSPQRAQKVRTRVKLLATYAVILAVLGLGSFGLNLYFQERRYQDLKGEIRKEFSQAVPDVKKVFNEIQQMKARVREEKDRLDSLGGSSGTGSPLEIIRDLSLVMDPAWKVRFTELAIDPETIEVSGETNSFDAVNQLKAKLDGSPLYREVQLKTARASGLENVIEFKLQMKRGT